jgi:hypothetical protein
MNSSFFELFKYVLIISVIISITIEGLKKHYIKIKKVDKVNPVIIVILSYIFGIAGSFLVSSDFITELWQKIIMGIIIGSWTAALYESAIKSVVNIIPKLTDKFLK